jgi:hypothetical protein
MTHWPLDSDRSSFLGVLHDEEVQVEHEAQVEVESHVEQAAHVEQ